MFFLDALSNIPGADSATPPTAKGFVLQVFPVVGALGSAALISDVQASIQNWSVVWVGVED